MTEEQRIYKEKIRELWQELLQAVDYEAWAGDVFLATMCFYVSGVIKKLIQGDVVGAQYQFWETQGLLLTSRTAREDSEVLHQSLYILDIGGFAWATAVYSRYGWVLEGYTKCFCDIVEVAKEIWDARQIFAPFLSDALLAAYKFIFNVQYTTPRRVFLYALRSPKFYTLTGPKFEDGFGIYSIVYGKKPIGHLLEGAAMAKLKDILRAYMGGRIGGSCVKKAGA